MKILTRYSGIINGARADVFNKVPENMIVKSQCTMIQADECKGFYRDGEFIDTLIVIEDNDSVENYNEEKLPEPEDEPEEVIEGENVE